ncbi:MAG: glycosyltransferase [Desulfobacterales bacterium]
MEKLDQYTVLPALGDVDEPGDVPLQISVIIPAINEEDYLQSLVKAAQNGFYTETIVADGGSGDRTQEIASQAGATVLQSRVGRAVQMNYGAQHAKE